MNNEIATETIKALVQGQTNSVHADVKIEPWPLQKRKSHAIKALMLSWLAAVVTILVPVLHFVLVPLFFVLGPVFFFLFFRKKTQVIGGEVKCPECEGLIRFHAQELTWPLKEVCDKEYHHVEIHPAEGSRA